MFWGAIAKGYKSRLYYFVENANSYTYQDIIYEWYHYDFLVFLK